MYGLSHEVSVLAESWYCLGLSFQDQRRLHGNISSAIAQYVSLKSVIEFQLLSQNLNISALKVDGVGIHIFFKIHSSIC